MLFANNIAYWPDGSENNINSAFGPRDPGTTGSWFHPGLDLQLNQFYKNPFNGPCRILDANGSGSNKWVTIVPINTGLINTFVLWHIEPWDGSQVKSIDWLKQQYVFTGKTIASGAQLPLKVNSAANHIHFEFFEEPMQSAQSAPDRYLYSDNPLTYYDYPDKSWYKANSWKIAPGDLNYKRNLWHNFGTEINENINMKYLRVHIYMQKPCFDVSKITAIRKNVGTWSWKGGPTYDYTTRGDFFNAPILRDMSTTYTSYYKNKYYQGSKIFSDPWTTGFKKVYFFFYPDNNEWLQNEAIVVKMVNSEGQTYMSNDIVPPTAPNSFPPPDAPRPPNWLTVSTQSDGIKLTWENVPYICTNGEPMLEGYLVYRRDILNPDKYSTQPLVYVGSTSMTQPITFVDKIDDALRGNQVVPQGQYAYSIATLGVNNEGCNGPFVDPNCNYVAQGCGGEPGGCDFTESIGTMPQKITFTLGDQIIYTHYQNVSATSTLNIQDIQVAHSRQVDFSSGSVINIYSKTVFENGCQVDIVIP